MKDYYSEFLQTKISVNTLPDAVTKVSKGQDTVKKQAFDTFDTVLPGVYQKNTYRNSDDLLDIKTDYFHTVLNRFIAAGVNFEVFADGFHFIDEWQNLKISDLEFLNLNKQDVLCQLQQSLLMKHRFSHSPELFEDFAFEITEREAIFLENCLNSQLTITAKTPFEIYFEAVKDITKK